MTEYVVLTEGEGPVYKVAATVEARSSEHAVRLVVEEINGELPPAGITHVAVSARSWRAGMHTFKVETKRRLIGSDG